MATNCTTERGMSLVEATIILMVLMLLTSVLAPSIYDFVVDARVVKVKEDCEAIGLSVVRLVGDVGPCLKFDGSDDCTPGNRVHTLFSRGDNAGWPTTNADDMEGQLTTNQANYPVPGWRGAYLPAPIGPDPWGSAYAVNVRYLAPQSDEECFIDTFCVSAGPNRRFDTPITGNSAGGTTRGGDDFTFVVGGGSCSTGNPPPPCTGPGCDDPPPCTGPGCDDPPPCTGDGCNHGTYPGGSTIGFWKNHEEKLPSPLSIWLGTANGSKSVQVTTAAQAVSILGQDGGSSNGIVKLYAQLMAAKLNIATWADGSSIQAVITQADHFLATRDASDWDKHAGFAQTVLGWHAALDAYNNALHQ